MVLQILSMAEAMTKSDEILNNAVENVLADDGFKIRTPSSLRTLGNSYSGFPPIR